MLLTNTQIEQFKNYLIGGILQTLEVASAENKTIKKTSARRQILIPGAVAAILAAVGWIMWLQFDRPADVRPPAAGYTIAKTIQYSYTLQKFLISKIINGINKIYTIRIFPLF